MEILDSHFHLYSMQKRGLNTTLPDTLIGIEVGTEPYDYEERRKLIANGIDYSHAAGPWCVANENYKGAKNTTEDIALCFDKYKGTFLGEIGLDYHWMYGTKEEQKALFIAQLDLAEELGLPVIIHSRDADDDLVDILKCRTFNHSGIMHCFSSGPDVMEVALERNLYISFAGNVTYRSNVRIQESAKLVPSDRILYETDSPYLAPVPMRGKPCHPEYTEYTSAFLAELREESTDELKKKAIENFKRLKALSAGSLL